MDRSQFEHIIRAATAATGAEEWIVIGSQSILGKHPDAPSELRESMELDIYTLKAPRPGDPDFSDLVSGAIGEYSVFQDTFGYWGDGVSPGTATLPRQWMNRTIRVKTPSMGGGTALCLEPHDLAVSKLVAGREKDIKYVARLLRHRLVELNVIEERLGDTDLDDVLRQACSDRLSLASHRASAL